MPSPATHQRRKQDRPQELLNAALTLFVEKGFAATRAEEVAALAGVSKGTLYLYYPGKEELLKAVVSTMLSTEIAAGAMEIEAHDGSMASLLLGYLVPWWQRIYDSPVSGVFKIIVTEACGFPELAEFYVKEVIEPGERAIGAVIERGIATGEFRPLDVSDVVHSMVLPLAMLCVHKHSIGACGAHQHQLDGPRFIRQHFELILHGLLASPGDIAPTTPIAAPHQSAAQRKK